MHTLLDEFEDFDELKELAEELQFPISEIIGYYEKIKCYPCVINRNDKQLLFECLYLIVFDIVCDRVSFSCSINEYDRLSCGDFKSHVEKGYKSVDDSISEALYRIYGDEALNDLPTKHQIFGRSKR